MNKLNGFKVAILVANGFEQIELTKPREALDNQAAQTFIISPEKNEVQGWNHMDKGDKFPVEVPLEEAKASDYDALLLPGGVFNPDKLRICEKAVSFVKDIKNQGKPIAAICHGPWLLINADAVKGHKITSWPSLKKDLLNAGASEWVDEQVVSDKLLVTSRNPDDIPKFNEAMIALFQKQH